MLSFQEWNSTKKNESFRQFWMNQNLIFETWPQPHCTMQGLMATKQYKRDEPKHSWLYTRYNKVQWSLKPMRTSDKLVYEITFDIPYEGLLQVPLPLGEDKDDTSIPVIALDDNETNGGIQDV